MSNPTYWIRNEQGIDIQVFHEHREAIEQARSFAQRHPGETFRIYRDGELVGTEFGVRF